MFNRCMRSISTVFKNAWVIQHGIARPRKLQYAMTASLLSLVVGCVDGPVSSTVHPLQSKVEEVAKANAIELADIIVNRVWKTPVQKNWATSAKLQDRWIITSNNLTAVRAVINEETSCGFENNQFSAGAQVKIWARKLPSAPDTSSRMLRLGVHLASNKCGVAGKYQFFHGKYPINKKLFISELARNGMKTENCVASLREEPSAFACFMDYNDTLRQKKSGYSGPPSPSLKINWNLEFKRCEFGFCFDDFQRMFNIVTVKSRDSNKSAFEIQNKYFSDIEERKRIDGFFASYISSSAGLVRKREKAADQEIKANNQAYANRLAQDKAANRKRLEKLKTNTSQSTTSSTYDSGDQIILDQVYTAPAPTQEGKAISDWDKTRTVQCWDGPKQVKPGQAHCTPKPVKSGIVLGNGKSGSRGLQK